MQYVYVYNYPTCARMTFNLWDAKCSTRCRYLQKPGKILGDFFFLFPTHCVNFLLLCSHKQRRTLISKERRRRKRTELAIEKEAGRLSPSWMVNSYSSVSLLDVWLQRLIQTMWYVSVVWRIVGGWRLSNYRKTSSGSSLPFDSCFFTLPHNVMSLLKVLVWSDSQTPKEWYGNQTSVHLCFSHSVQSKLLWRANPSTCKWGHTSIWLVVSLAMIVMQAFHFLVLLHGGQSGGVSCLSLLEALHSMVHSMASSQTWQKRENETIRNWDQDIWSARTMSDDFFPGCFDLTTPFDKNPWHHFH